MRPTVENLADRYEYIFIGEVTSESGVFNSWTVVSTEYSIRTAMVFKGDVGERVTLWSKRSEAACGRNYEVGSSYVFFAAGEWWGYRSGLCTSALVERSEALIRNLYDTLSPNKSFNGDAAKGHAR